ncbi:MAG: IS4 family transposase, partial [Candidatus Sumerlaeota bacterium]|nr:IS4 family transposase [Candidatus Sumerlaeota bacterium]
QHLAFGSLHVSETALFRRLWLQLERGDVILADRLFCSFGLYWMLAQHGVDCAMRLIVRRSSGQRQVRKLGRGDCLMAWSKSSRAPQWIEPAVWAAMPKELVIRQIAINVDVPGFRTETIFVVTTLLDPKMFPARSFADLYRRRWQIELYFRDLKTSLRMENLKCQSPKMIAKELWMYVIAHNLIRLIIAQAAAIKGMEPRRISFKRTADALKEWLPLIYAHAGDIEWRRRMQLLLLRHIASLVVPYRPNRSEPRARKRRPKPYALLTCHRSVYKETAHRNRYKPAKA